MINTHPQHQYIYIYQSQVQFKTVKCMFKQYKAMLMFCCAVESSLILVYLYNILLYYSLYHQRNRAQIQGKCSNQTYDRMMKIVPIQLLLQFFIQIFLYFRPEIKIKESIQNIEQSEDLDYYFISYQIYHNAQRQLIYYIYMYPHHHHHHHRHHNNMGTGMQVQGQIDMNMGRQQAQFGNMEYNQGMMEKNIGYQQERRGMMEIAQGNFGQGMRDLMMGQQEVNMGNAQMRMGANDMNMGQYQMQRGMNEFATGTQINNMGYGMGNMGNGMGNMGYGGNMGFGGNMGYRPF